MPTVFSLRNARPADALGILEAHRSAVRGTAAKTYSAEVIEGWAAAVISPERVEAFAQSIAGDEEVVVVAERPCGEIIGFGSIIPRNSELRAVYVRTEDSGKGVGSAILDHLERLARRAGLAELHMDATLNAADFYADRGFIALERAEHTLQSGVRMACVRMRKSL